jgi:hypothetical protein
MKNDPRKPNANIALNNDIADIYEQVSSDTVHICTFSKYQPRERKRSSHRKGGASFLTVRGSVNGQLFVVLIDSGCQLESVLSSPCVERLGLAHNSASLQTERWDMSPLNVVEQPTPRGPIRL